MPSHVLMSVNVGQLKAGDIWMSSVHDYDVISVSEHPEIPEHVLVELRFTDATSSDATFTVTHLKTHSVRAFVKY